MNKYFRAKNNYLPDPEEKILSSLLFLRGKHKLLIKELKTLSLLAASNLFPSDDS